MAASLSGKVARRSAEINGGRPRAREKYDVTAAFPVRLVYNSGTLAHPRRKRVARMSHLNTVAAFDRIGEENAFAVLARANALAAQGRDIINLGIGQPDFRTPEHIVEAAVKALQDGHHGYTPAIGILPLREAVARRTLQTTGT